MNQTWNSFFQTVFQFVKALFTNASKKMHRDVVVLTAGISVVTMVTFTAGDLRGGGRNALVAFAETGQKEETDSMNDSGSGKDGEQENENTEETGEGPLQEERAFAEGTDPEDSGNGETVLEGGSRGQDENPEAAGGITKEASDGITKEASDEITEEAADETAKEAVDETAKEASDTRVTLSDRDYKVLLKIVQAEAGNCDKKGRILVANVILNRVESSRFPDTVTGVVYERNQFSPVKDGSLDRCRVSKETVEAVKCALSGEDYSAGALYFMNRSTSSGKNVRWFDNHLDYLFKHGSHEFFK